MSAHLFPCTIVATRYGGAYEGSTSDAEGQIITFGGTWAAFSCSPDLIPADAFLDDVTAARWWEQIEDGRWRLANADQVVRVEFGSTPNEALERLAHGR